MTQTIPIYTEIELPNLTLFKKGKVRSVFDLGEHLLIVASDRVSAFDYILPNGIPKKGETLTQISKFWFNYLENDFKHHLIATDVADFPKICHEYAPILKGRSMLVKKTELIPIECVVRGYIIGTGWKDYQKTGSVCGIPLPKDLQLAEKLAEPIFTPAFKAETGHDENISLKEASKLVGQDVVQFLQETSLSIYSQGRDYAESKGIILADTKFEFGKIGDDIILIDEVLTPDSSRYWPASEYKPGMSPPSYDKQIIRDYLEKTWDKNPPVPSLPEDIITKASERYLELKEILLS